MASSESNIPFRIRIGIAGHRKLAHEAGVRDAVGRILQNYIHELFDDGTRKLLAAAQDTSLCYQVITSLADGTDQIVADEIRHATPAGITAVLPLEELEYKATISPGCLAKFDRLLKADRNPRRLRRLPLAHEFYTASPSELQHKRDEAYDAAGRYIVDHCDVLVAVWDQTPVPHIGAPGARQPGDGTKNTVEYARKRHRPLIIIHADDPQIIESDLMNRISAPAIPALDAFNKFGVKAEMFKSERQRVKSEIFGSERDEKTAKVLNAARDLPAQSKEAICETLIPWYVRAERMARANQRWFHWAGLLGYTLAALAVVFVAAAVLLPELKPVAVLFPALARYMFGSEFFCLLAVVLIILATERFRVHQKWIESRFLAERLRSAFYVAACGLDVSPVEVPGYLGVAHQPDDWMVRVFEEVWARLPKLPGCKGSACAPYREFVSSSWIQGQIKYHKGKSKDHHLTSRLLERAGLALFGIAMLAAAAHFLAGDSLAKESHTTDVILTMIAISAPAIGSALAGIRTHREYARLVKRSGQMASVLRDLDVRLNETTQPEQLEVILRETEELMLRETQEWLMLMRLARMDPA